MEAIKPRQTINYDAGIVLIDLHQLNVKQLQTIQISDTEYGATSCQRRTEPAEQQPATSAFPNQTIEQINALEQKGSGNFSAWSLSSRRRLTSEKESIYINSCVMKNEHPAFFPPKLDDIVIYLITRALQ